MRFLLVCFLIAQVSCFPRHEEDEARVLSEVWDAMEKHHGDDIIVIPRREGPESEHHGDHHDSPSHEGPSHEGPNHEESKDRPESEHTNETESSSESPKPEAAALESSGSSEHSDESSRGHHGHEGSDENSERMWDKFNRIGDIMNRAVERLRKDDREFHENESSSSGGGLTVLILEIVGAVVVGLILVALLMVGLIKGIKGLKSWKARRQSERLVDQEAPNMDGTGYQSGYNP